MDGADNSEPAPLEDGRTDFYFIGYIGAGKTTILASLLAYWIQEGNCEPNSGNVRGNQYFKTIGGGLSKGILPSRTVNQFIDYIDLTLSTTRKEKTLFGCWKEKSYDIPVNLLDLAGEKFVDVANEGMDKFDLHLKYLKNQNLKSIFLVVDYTLEKDFNQKIDYPSVLDVLKRMGILDKTNSIYLIVSKADLFPVSLSEHYKFANEFINRNYKALKEKILKHQKQYDFSFEIMPYSIGPCVYGTLVKEAKIERNEILMKYARELSALIEKDSPKFGRSLLSH
jgi:hypothetical protein